MALIVAFLNIGNSCKVSLGVENVRPSSLYFLGKSH